ncbi:MAG: glycosyltransferase family 4 protein [Planctomycetes bacterium]|nr:glycosyltransferase family 4 protein [Planctomycetota bacterium]
MNITSPHSPTLRFCVVTTFYPPYNFGGDGIYAHRLANGLAKLGHKVTVLHSPTAYEILAGSKPSDSYNDHKNVTIHPIRTPLGKLGLLAVQQLGRPALQAPALRRWLNHGNFDVIHYNNVSLLGGPHVFRYGTGLKLCTLIEHWLVCPMHVLWKFNREVCIKPSCFLCTIYGRRPPQLWRYTGLMRRATRSIDAFIGPSRFTIEMHRERGLQGKMVQLPLFHTEPDVESESASSFDESSDRRPYFLFVGRLERIKGLQTIIPAFRDLPDVDLVVAGSGSYEEQLKLMAEGAPNIRFIGLKDVRQLQSLYRDAVATIVPSLCYETFGIIVAESFATRTPVIVRNHSSLREFIESYGGGFTFSTDVELRSAIDKLLCDKELRNRLGQQGRVAYDAEFGEGPFLEHYLTEVHRLLAAKRMLSAVNSEASLPANCEIDQI